MITSEALKKRLLALLIVCSTMPKQDYHDLCEVMDEYKALIQWCPAQVDRTAYQALYKGFYGARHMTSKLSNNEKEDCWKNYFKLLAEQPQAKRSLQEIIEILHPLTHRWEVSYSTKLLATADPWRPVIDRFVKKELHVKAPNRNATDFVEVWCSIYAEIEKIYNEVLVSNDDGDFVKHFDEVFPSLRDLTPVKKIDVLLWQGSRLTSGGQKNRIRRYQKAFIALTNQ